MSQSVERQGPAAQAAFDLALSGIKALPPHLFTPQAWAQVAMREATEQLGTFEGAAKLAEAKRYMACAELTNRLLTRIQALEAAARGRGT